MKSNHLVWLVLPIALLISVLLFSSRWFSLRRRGWKYKNEIIPGLGNVQAVYQNGELLSYDFNQDGVKLSVNCQIPENKESALIAAQKITKADINRHLQQAVQTIPANELKIWRFDKGEWTMETIFINGENFLVLELVNSHDQDHCCRVVFEKGKYEFECVDG